MGDEQRWDSARQTGGAPTADGGQRAGRARMTLDQRRKKLCPYPAVSASLKWWIGITVFVGLSMIPMIFDGAASSDISGFLCLIVMYSVPLLWLYSRALNKRRAWMDAFEDEAVLDDYETHLKADAQRESQERSRAIAVGILNSRLKEARAVFTGSYLAKVQAQIRSCDDSYLKRTRDQPFSKFVSELMDSI